MDMERLEEDLSQIEDMAWYARSEAYAVRFVLGNLLLELRRAKLMDPTPLIASLLSQVEVIPDAQGRQGAQELLQALLASLAGQVLDTSSEVPPGTVFH